MFNRHAIETLTGEELRRGIAFERELQQAEAQYQSYIELFRARGRAGEIQEDEIRLAACRKYIARIKLILYGVLNQDRFTNTTSVVFIGDTLSRDVFVLCLGYDGYNSKLASNRLSNYVQGMMKQLTLKDEEILTELFETEELPSKVKMFNLDTDYQYLLTDIEKVTHPYDPYKLTADHGNDIADFICDIDDTLHMGYMREDSVTYLRAIRQSIQQYQDEQLTLARSFDRPTHSQVTLTNFKQGAGRCK